MNIIETVSKVVMIQHLVSLGCGNHTGNMKELGLREVDNRFNHYLAELNEDEFFKLVFLHTDELACIVPNTKNRSLIIAAQNALCQLKIKPRLNTNWDLENIEEMTSIWLKRNCPLPALVLRDSRNSECKTGEWYLQDGSHRALGYCMAILCKSTDYQTVKVFIATHRNLK